MSETSTLDELTIFYTYNLQGDLARLPKLYTFLQQLKREHAPRPLILDLGASCADDVWHCAATGGRSTLVVLDGMGYHAANVSDFLDSQQRHQLKRVISTGMVDAEHGWRLHLPPFRDDGIIVAGTETPALRLCIVAAPAEATTLNGGTLRLQAIDATQVGIVRLTLQDTPQLLSQTVVDVPDTLKPDATIAAAIEFVQDEARRVQ